MVLAELPRGREIDYMFFSTRHWAHLLTGYSGFIPADPELDEALAAFPSADAVASLRRRGATHVTYNCYFERSETRCSTYMKELEENATLALIAEARWQGADVRLYEFR